MSEYLLTWAAEEKPRWEQARVELGLGRMRARGTVLAGGEDPYRADYELDTVAGLVTRRLLIRVAGRGYARELLLTRDQDGEWAARRAAEHSDRPEHLDTGALTGALDCDLQESPLTNTMPAVRHALHRREGREEFTMAFVTLPELTVRAVTQTYEHIRAEDDGGALRYSSGTFEAEITFDRAGFVTAYPGVGHSA